MALGAQAARRRITSQRALLLPFGLVLIAAAAHGCGAPSAERANLLLISLDTTRADHLSVYGYPRDTSPRLRDLAAEGVRVEIAYAPTATTAPSHASLFTALPPRRHRVIKNGQTLAGTNRTLAERLAAAGYQTAACVSSFVLASRFGYHQGFDFYEDDFEKRHSKSKKPRWLGHDVRTGFDRRGGETVRRAIAWLETVRDPGHPFFLFVHLFDPHSPYDPPEPFRSRFARAPPAGAEPDQIEVQTDLYDGEIAYADAQVAALLEALDAAGLAGETLVMVTGDHGQGLGQRGYARHGIHLTEEQVRVPLIARWPGRIPAGRVLTGPVELMDLAPTLLALLGVDFADADFQGRNLAAAFTEEAPLDPDHPVYLERRHYRPQRVGGFDVRGEMLALRSGRWKYIEAPDEGTRELYDLEADPGEVENLFQREPDRANALAAELQAWRDRQPAPESEPGPPAPDAAALLRALGYVE
jgi:arylsulfatase A-like enzyme